MAQGGVLWSAVLLSLVSLLGPVGAHYTPTWAVHIPGGKEAADAVATDHGFVNLGEIFSDHYHFHHHAIAKRSTEPAHAHHSRLEADSRVRWAKQQRALSRVKRDFQYISLSSTAETLPKESPTAGPSKREASKRDARGRTRPRSTDAKFQLNDPKWQHMWYLNRGGGLDMNVIPAWREGITGRGIVVTILDDGLETDHPDLAANYDPMASYDVNSHDSDPQPRYDMIDSNRHGTRCAGEVAATANNSLCAVGVAFGASVGGVRMLDGDVTDAVEARSLSLNPQHVDIYSASWGPDDDGKTVDGPGELATRAFIEGVTKGRDGKGSIFVWASGNGGREHDNCNCDGYTNSIWTLSISSATERGEVPWYSERCSSTLATTYSSGAVNDKQVVTTDLHHSCTTGHTGTSASAPLAAGICALALHANNNLTWRDMQHIVVRTARPERLGAGGEWRVNGAGRNVSHSFGYGLLDAAAMVRLARAWRRVPPQRRCKLAAPRPPAALPPRASVSLALDVSACAGVNYLEHVQARVSLAAARRGDLRISLTSPAGTRVTLLTPRPHDSSRAGFSSWPFMSVHMWGESPLGVWQLDVTNEGRYMAGPMTQWELIFYGTETPPQESDAAPEVPPPEAEAPLSVAPPPEVPHSAVPPPGWPEAPPILDVQHNDLDDASYLHAHTISEDSPSEGGDVDGVGGAGPFAGNSSGCVSASQPPLCLECARGLLLFAGGCRTACPEGTFAKLRGSRRRNLTLPYRDVGEALEAMDMEPTANRGSCEACHASCATCDGEGAQRCTSCREGTRLAAKRCQPASQLAGLIRYPQLGIALALLSVALCGLPLACWLLRRGPPSVAYDKLALDETERSAAEVEDEIRRALTGAETDSDDDLRL